MLEKIRIDSLAAIERYKAEQASGARKPPEANGAKAISVNSSPTATARPSPSQSWWSSANKMFGPMMWKRLHQWAATGDPKDADRWLAGFANQLPCGKCRQHFQQLLRDNPPPKTTNHANAVWTYQIHNIVNRTKDNPSPEISWADAVSAQGWLADWL